MSRLFALLGLLWFAPVQAGELLHNATGLDAEGLGGDFTLQGPGGRALSLSDFRGRIVLLYFGYTHCPDVCPMSLGILQQSMARLTPEEGREVQGLFVTIDPQRDHGERLQEYVRYFHPSFIGLEGDPEALHAAARAFGVLFAREEGSPATGYLMAHTDHIYLLDPRGTLRALYNSSSAPAQVAEGVRALLAEARK